MKAYKDVLAEETGEPEFTGNPWAMSDLLLGEESSEN